MALGWKTIIEGVNPEVVAEIGDDVVIIRHNAVPTNGVGGTGAGIAGPGSLVITTLGGLYINTGSKDSPAWSSLMPGESTE